MGRLFTISVYDYSLIVSTLDGSVDVFAGKFVRNFIPLNTAQLEFTYSERDNQSCIRQLLVDNNDDKTKSWALSWCSEDLARMKLVEVDVSKRWRYNVVTAVARTLSLFFALRIRVVHVFHTEALPQEVVLVIIQRFIQ